MRNKIIAGLVFGAILGMVDGSTAWFTPTGGRRLRASWQVRPVKGMVVGLLSGWFARKVNSTAWGIIFGSVMGLIFAYLVAVMPDPSGRHYYLEIMLPGFVSGAIIGFLTQRAGSNVKQTT